MSTLRTVGRVVNHPVGAVKKVANASKNANIADQHRIENLKNSNYTEQTLKKYSAENVCEAVEKFLREKNQSTSDHLMAAAIEMIRKYNKHIVHFDNGVNVPEAFHYDIHWQPRRQ